MSETSPSAKAIPGQVAFLTSEDGRQFRRRAVNFAAILEEQDATASEVSVLDLSERGFRVRTDDDLKVGSPLFVKLPGAEAVRAKIVWSRNGEAGCEFDEELRSGTLEMIVASATPKRRIVDARTGKRWFGTGGTDLHQS